ncbi:MAG: oligosaccharide flippase family protein [Bacteroidetes bacterium]|nr:oligosaccharide flippase family protein [Bacteroidota bacterium]
MGIIARQSFKASISNYLGILLGFLSLFLLFPKFYTPHDLGAIRLLLETGAVLSSFALLGTNYSINRFFPYFKTEDKRHNGFFFWAFMIPLVGFALVFTGLIWFEKPLLALFGKDASILESLYPPLLLLVFFSLFQVVLETCNSNHGRIAVSNFLREVVLRCIILAAGTLFFLNYIDFITSVWIMVCAYGIIVIFNFIYLRTLTDIHLIPDFNFMRKNKELGKDALRFTAFLFIGGVTTLVVGKIDFLMISAKKGLTDTAIYSVGYYLAIMIEIPKRTILQVAAPIISQKMKDGNKKEVHHIYRSITLNQLLAASLIFFFIWLNIDNLFQIMPKGEIFKAGKMVIFIMGLGRLLDMVGSAGGPIIANSKYYYFSLINFLISLVVAIGANLLLIPILGINGAALATVFTFLLSNGTLIWIIYIKEGFHPFSSNHLKIMLVLSVFLIPTYFGKWLENPFLDGIVRTVVLGIPFLWICYKWKISEDFNKLLDKGLKMLKKSN